MRNHVEFKNLRFVAAAAAALLLGSAPTYCLAADRKPNIVIIVAEGAPSHGDKDVATPNIDALAKSGTTFAHGYSAAPLPGPSSAALLTGRYPQRFGFDADAEGEPAPADHGKRALDLAQSTLAGDLKAAGYTTGIFGNWYLGSGDGYLPTQRGFDEFYGVLSSGGAGPEGPAVYHGTTVAEKPKDLVDQAGAEASAFIDHHAGDPLFVYLPLAGESGAVDHVVGAIAAKLHERGLEENTLVIFVNDEAVGGWALFDRDLHSPMIVTWKGKVPPALVLDQPVMQLDLAPTALSAAGVELKPERQADGKSLLPLLLGQNHDSPDNTLYWRLGVQYAVRQGNWKLLKLGGDARPRLFYLQDDPGENLDLFQQQGERAKSLQTLWDAWNAGNEPPRWVDDRWNSTGNDTLAAGPSRAAGPWKSGDSLPNTQAPNIARKALEISAEIEPAGTEGIIVTQGGTGNGYAIYLADGKLAFAVREKGELTTIIAKEPLGNGHFLVRATLDEDGALTLLADGKQIAEGKAPGLIPQQPKAGFFVGKAGAGAVGEYQTPDPFDGKVTNVRVKTIGGK